ncbi:MAG: helix-turn-helix domain-containing protein [Sciscionella sp.]
MAGTPTPPQARIAAALRAERGRSGWSLSELAKRADIAKSTLSQLEAGMGNPSVETLWALAIALDVPFARLVDPPQPAVRVMRAAEQLTLPSSHANYLVALLATGHPHAVRDLYLVRAEPGKAKQSAAHQPGTVEHYVVCTGGALIGPVDDPVELWAGDYIRYAGDVPHLFRALSEGTTAVHIGEHP